MNTVIMRSKARKTSRGSTYSIQIIGDSPAKPAMLESVKALEHHPAPTAQRNIINMLGLIEQHNLQIRHTEHERTEDNLEQWMFVLQG